VGHKAFHRIGNRHAIDQQDRVDSKEIEQGNQLASAFTEVFFYDFGDVFPGFLPERTKRVRPRWAKKVMGKRESP
jgi:hypothetical protein